MGRSTLAASSQSVKGHSKVRSRPRGGAKGSLAQWVNCLLLQRSIKSRYHLQTRNPAKRLEPFNHSLSARSLNNSLIIGLSLEGISVLQGACCLCSAKEILSPVPIYKVEVITANSIHEKTQNCS